MVYPLGTRYLKTRSGAEWLEQEEVIKLVLEEVSPVYGDVMVDKSITSEHDDPV